MFKKPKRRHMLFSIVMNALLMLFSGSTMIEYFLEFNNWRFWATFAATLVFAIFTIITLKQFLRK